MRKILIGTAALAIAAMTTAYSLPADAQERGNGKSNGNGNAQAQQRGGGGDGNGNGNAKPADRGPQMQARGQQRGGNGNGNADAATRGPQMQARGQGQERGDRRGNANAGNRGGDRERGNGNAVAQAARGGGDVDRGNRGRERDYYRTDDRYRDGDGPFFARAARGGNPGLIDGCPPGLAKKRNGCLPPGQARKRDYDAGWFGFSGNDYRYRDGYMVRYGDNGISGFIPLLGGALSIGRSWPGDLGVARVPEYYQSYYNLGDDYRYYNNTLYRLDPETSAITSIAALITGDDITVGQRMPAGYDVYNVPMGYRDRYNDRPDANYRYSDGYIYQVDPKTRLVAAAIELLT